MKQVLDAMEQAHLILRGGVRLTLVSTRTGQCITYDISLPRRNPQLRFVAVVRGRPRYVGYVLVNFAAEVPVTYRHGRCSLLDERTLAGRAFAWWVDHLGDPRVEVWLIRRSGGKALDRADRA